MRVFLALLALIVAAAAAVAAAAWMWLDRPLTLAQPSIELSIEPGMQPREIVGAWVQAGVQTDPDWLYAWFRASGQARRIKAGSYEVHTGITPRGLLAVMLQGKESLLTVRLTEGWTLKQVRAALAAAPHLKPTTAQWSDAQLMEALGTPGVWAEGRLFPDTYAYARGVSDLTVLRRAHRLMREKLAAAWTDRAPDTPLKNADEALILASIVEKETGAPQDRGQVAGVFTNRLRIGMPLQTDPTVIYGMGAAFDGNLRKTDLQTDTPYNTYLRRGLPPSAIALPSEASLRAAVRPDATKALYFVARGDGSSAFSATLAEHNRAVNKYQRGQP